VAVAVQDRDTVRAQARYVRCSARKARLVLEHIRGKQAAEAAAILAFQPRAAARDAGKVLASAIANAENNNGYDADDLVVVAAYADEGPTLKRWRPRARGRVNRIRKRTCHITIQLAVAEPGEIKKPVRRRPAAAPKAQPAPEPAVDETTTDVDETEEAPAEEAPKPKPKRKPRAKKTDQTEASTSEASPDSEASAGETPEAPTEPAAEGSEEEKK
jgi:large subunit ribosomal protein L22